MGGPCLEYSGRIFLGFNLAPVRSVYSVEREKNTISAACGRDGSSRSVDASFAQPLPALTVISFSLPDLLILHPPPPSPPFAVSEFYRSSVCVSKRDGHLFYMLVLFGFL